MARYDVNVHSEFGELECVVVHTPGAEVENMSPDTVKEALYNDILSLEYTRAEHALFKGALSQVTHVLEVEDLLVEVLDNAEERRQLLAKLLPNDAPDSLREELLSQSSTKLAKSLLEGVMLPNMSHTGYAKVEERYVLPPLYNFYFMRDASISVFNRALIGRMLSHVRWGEAMIMSSIFSKSRSVHAAEVMNPYEGEPAANLKIEGGDVHIVRNDVLMIGCGLRTSMAGVEYLLEQMKGAMKHPLHILVQELPTYRDSFIHLDMLFTLLGPEHCMAYKPLLDSPEYRTLHILYDPKKGVSSWYEENLVEALHGLGIGVEPIYCAGGDNLRAAMREQFHSGANFFAFAPHKVLGYDRNPKTIEALNKAGFAVLPASDVAAGKLKPSDYAKCVVTVHSAELVRGGGGARCMTLPISRKPVLW